MMISYIKKIIYIKPGKGLSTFFVTDPQVGASPKETALSNYKKIYGAVL
jgi:hypothetical protein